MKRPGKLIKVTRWGICHPIVSPSVCLSAGLTHQIPQGKPITSPSNNFGPTKISCSCLNHCSIPSFLPFCSRSQASPVPAGTLEIASVSSARVFWRSSHWASMSAHCFFTSSTNLGGQVPSAPRVMWDDGKNGLKLMAKGWQRTQLRIS